MRLLFCGLALFSACATATAAPTDSVLFATAGAWSIYSDPTTANSCFAISSFGDGTSIRVGFWHKGYKYPAYVAFSNAKWRSIQSRKEYQVSMQLDSAAPWRGVASGWIIGTDKAILINVDKPSLFKEFVRSDHVRLTFRDKEIANLSLNGSGRAITELMNCQAANVDGKPLVAPAPEDPFAIQEATPKSDDPFEL